VIDASAFQLLLMVLTGWLARREREVVDYLIEENRRLCRQLERNDQGLDNRLIMGTPAADAARPVRRRSRLGGLPNYYERAA
jgi:hypothetical protein